MVPRTAVVALLLVAGQCLAADPQDERFQKLADAMQAAKEAKLQAMDASIQSLIKRKAGGVPIRKARAERDALAKSGELATEALKDDLKVGTVGTLPYRVTVLQVRGPNELLATVRWSRTVITTSGSSLQRGKFAFVPQEISNDVLVFFQGIDTAGMADDSNQTEAVRGLTFEVSGTRTYQTAAGSNTVMVVKPIDLAAFEAWRKSKKK